ncbi:hypothetical protein GMB80_12090 [Turicibacter sanguinis]|nr:hypothetical protein [Turicibacter sanguinis]
MNIKVHLKNKEVINLNDFKYVITRTSSNETIKIEEVECRFLKSKRPLTFVGEKEMYTFRSEDIHYLYFEN